VVSVRKIKNSHKRISINEAHMNYIAIKKCKLYHDLCIPVNRHVNKHLFEMDGDGFIKYTFNARLAWGSLLM